MKVVPCLLLCVSLYCAFQVNRCVRPYMVGTHVRRKNGKFLHIGVFFRLAVWYTQLNKSEFKEVLLCARRRNPTELGWIPLLL